MENPKLDGKHTYLFANRWNDRYCTVEYWGSKVYTRRPFFRLWTTIANFSARRDNCWRSCRHHSRIGCQPHLSTNILGLWECISLNWSDTKWVNRVYRSQLRCRNHQCGWRYWIYSHQSKHGRWNRSTSVFVQYTTEWQSNTDSIASFRKPLSKHQPSYRNCSRYAIFWSTDHLTTDLHNGSRNP